MEDVFSRFRSQADPARAAQMSAYMKGLFPFVGLPTPLRRALGKTTLDQMKKADEVDWPFVLRCYDQPEREFQYLALDYLNAVKRLLKPADMASIERLIQMKSWWDSVDSLDQIVGFLIVAYPELKDSHIRRWMRAEDRWLRRVAIDCQLGFRERTDRALLAEAIVSNLGGTEFFVNKAIGWSLRDFSKTDPEWVRAFIAGYRDQLHSLSIREACKYL